jgi:hypothetical protein
LTSKDSQIVGLIDARSDDPGVGVDVVITAENRLQGRVDLHSLRHSRGLFTNPENLKEFIAAANPLALNERIDGVAIDAAGENDVTRFVDGSHDGEGEVFPRAMRQRLVIDHDCSHMGAYGRVKNQCEDYRQQDLKPGFCAGSSTDLHRCLPPEMKRCKTKEAIF